MLSIFSARVRLPCSRPITRCVRERYFPEASRGRRAAGSAVRGEVRIAAVAAALIVIALAAVIMLELSDTQRKWVPWMIVIAFAAGALVLGRGRSARR